jgi:hypothetical protein
VNPPITGSISGIIGAGGNTGAVVFGLFFRQYSAQFALLLMGAGILMSSILSIFIFIKGQPGLIWRTTVGQQPAAAVLQTDCSDVNDELKASSKDIDTASSEETSSCSSGSKATGSHCQVENERIELSFESRQGVNSPSQLE